MSKKYFFTDNNGNTYPEWGQNKLENILEVCQNGTNANQNLYKKGFPVTRIETISTGKINMSKVGYVETNDSLEKHLLKPDDILFSNINSIEHIGKTAIVPVELSKLYHGMNLLLLRANGVTSGKYLFHYLNTNTARNHFRMIANKAVSQASINQTEVAKTPIPLPSLPEQQKIAEFFSALDERIALTADKVKLLKEQKTGYLQKVFNRELVFADDKGDIYADWEQKKLGEMLDLCQSGTSATQNLYKKGYPVTRIETISSGKINMSKIGYVESDISLEKYLMKPADILFSNINSIEHIGKTAIVSDDLPTLYHGMNLLLLRANANNSGQYIFHYLNTDSARSYFRKIANKAVSQASINQTEVSKAVIPTPSLPEQEKIAEFFSALDEQIELTENKLTLLKEQKKGYLQGIFG